MDNEALSRVIDEANRKRQGKQAQTGATQTPTTAAGKRYDQAKLERDLKFHGIERRFLGVTLASIEQRLPANENIRRNFSYVKQYAMHLPEHISRGEGIIMAGGYGTMKTSMAVAVLRHQLAGGNGGGYLVPMATMIDNLFTMRSRDRDEAARYEERLRITPLLIIDDLGSENTAQDWITAKTDSIITERYNRLLPTIITTNFSAKDLSDTYGGRILDRIKSSCYYLEFHGGSERRALGIETI